MNEETSTDHEIIRLVDRVRSLLSEKENYIAQLEKLRDEHYENFCKNHPLLEPHDGSRLPYVRHHGALSGGYAIQSIILEYETTYGVTLSNHKDTLLSSMNQLQSLLEQEIKEKEVYKAYYTRDEDAYIEKTMKEAPIFRTPLHKKNFLAERRREFRMKVELDPEKQLSWSPS